MIKRCTVEGRNDQLVQQKKWANSNSGYGTDSCTFAEIH